MGWSICLQFCPFQSLEALFLDWLFFFLPSQSEYGDGDDNGTSIKSCHFTNFGEGEGEQVKVVEVKGGTT